MCVGQASPAGAESGKASPDFKTTNWNAVTSVRNPDYLSSLNEHEESLP